MRQCLHVHHFGFLTLSVKTENFETKLRRPSFELIGYIMYIRKRKKQLINLEESYLTYNFNVYKEMFIGFVLKYLDKML